MCVFVNSYLLNTEIFIIFDWVKDFLVLYLALHGVSLAMKEETIPK